MTTTLNLDDFCKDVARALIILASVFPRPRDLFVEDVYRAEETDEFGMHSDRYLACFQALVWLREEGFIRFTNTLRSDAIEQAVLTGRALALLIQPTSLEGESAAVAIEHNTLLQALRTGLQEGSSTATRLHVLGLISDMVRYPSMPPPVVPGETPDQAI
jgi:hypothetical protein